MRYESLGQGSQFPYPDNSVPADEKGKDFCVQYAKAAYYDFQYSYPKGVFASNGGDYEKYRMYALGKQPISIYKKMLGVDQQTNNTWLSIDWSVRAVVSGYRDKAISRLMKEDYSVVATPIDMLAKTEETEYYSDMKARLMVREMMIKQNPELASHPLIQLQSGEPMDLEEMQMRVELGEQFNRSKDAELAIELGLYENDYKSFRRAIYEDLFDFGVAGCKDWLGDDNKAKFRRVNPERVVVSFCKDSTFKDMVHAGEVIDVPLIELATITDAEGNRMFSEDDLQEFAFSLAGKFGNPATVGKNSGWFKPYDKFKCQVLDIEFYTYNEETYSYRNDANGNPVIRKERSGRGEKTNPRYKRKTIQYVYKCKWIVGTDKAYDFGMAYDQKRANEPAKKAKTKLSYNFCAYNFYQMKAQGFMERLVPYLDDYQLTIYKIQNFKNRAVPSGWWIDLDALENVALSKGGAAMQPKELLQMFFETGVLVGRSQDAAGNPMGPNWKPVIPIENTAASELAMFYQDLLNTVMTIEKMTGYNDITSGNPNPKTLVPGYEMAQQSTNDALYPMAFAEEYLTLCLSEDVLCRMQQGLRRGGISGYAPALNTNTLRAIQLNPGIKLRDYGIELQKKTTDDQKMWLLQQMQQDIANGFLNTSDAVMLVNTQNVKQCQAIWAYRVKKEKERMQEYELQKIQMNNQGASEAAQMAAQLKAQEIDQDWQYKLQEKQMELQATLASKQMELQAQLQMKQLEMQVKYQIGAELNDAKRDVASTTAEAKIIAADIDQDGKAIAAEIQGVHSQQKQEIANQKPQAPAKK